MWLLENVFNSKTTLSMCDIEYHRSHAGLMLGSRNIERLPLGDVHQGSHGVSVSSRETSETCLSSWEPLIGPRRAGPTSAERSLYVGGVATFIGAPFWAIAPKLPAHERTKYNQSWAGALERCMGVPNHRDGRERHYSSSGWDILGEFSECVLCVYICTY